MAGTWDLTKVVDLCQIALLVPLSSRPSVRCVPQLHGWMTLIERHPIRYFRAKISNVAEQERYKAQSGDFLQVSLYASR